MTCKHYSFKNSALFPLIFFIFLFTFTQTENTICAQGLSDKEISPREIQSFDANWHFYKGDIEGAQERTFKDKDWRSLDVPHDWSIEGEVSRDNTTGRGGGYFPAGIGWYRKSFTVPKEDQGKHVFIEFDGIMANSQVWLNGHMLGQRPYGYVSFSYEMTPYLNYGKKENIIAVKADNSIQPASRWYTGAGIYRHVRLVTTENVHIPQWGVFITTPDVSGDKATVKIQTTIVNQSVSDADVKIVTTMLNPSGKMVGKAELSNQVKAGDTVDFTSDLAVANPERWNIENPVLYTAVSKIYQGKELVDEMTNIFGIREFHFDAATGFWLNGKNIKIKGVAVHQDGGALGVAVPITTWKLRFEQLKKLGVNAIRTAHNPFAPEFYDLCDKMGFLVMDETFDTWRAAKNHAEKGYNLYFDKWWRPDTRSMVMRDRNHPSLIIYSVGNEIRDDLSDEQGFSTYRKLQDLVHEFDPSRPVTMALFRPNSSGVYQNGFADMMDVVGQNYRENELVEAHLDKPSRKVIGTENGHSQSAWLVLRDNPFMSGQFLWTGIDYLGEANWPAISHHFGLLDRTGRETVWSYQRQSWWSDKAMVHLVRSAFNAGNGDLVSDWSPADQDTYDIAAVEVYANTQEIEIFLNGKSKGIFQVPENAAPVRTKFTFEPGTIKVVGRNNGKEVAVQEMQTAGEPAKVVLTPSSTQLKKDFDDVVYVTARVTDENGITCPNADQLLNFLLTGPGKILAVDNADLETHIPFSETSRRPLNGRCIAIIRAIDKTGEIKLNVTADGLEQGTVTLNIEK